MSNTKSNTNQHGNSELKDEEIIKALECCVDYETPCKECPLRKKRNCIDDVKKNVLDLINRQKAEIERLETMHSEMCIGMKTLKKKAIKEFAERLKEVFTTIDGTFECWEVEEHIDNLVKEMESKKQ